MQLNIGKLSMWRIQTHELFGGTWLTDYVDNKLNGFIQEPVKPKCPIIGADSNIFNIMGIASRTLKRNDMTEESKEMCSRVTSSGGYEEALGIIMEYVEPCTEEEMFCRRNYRRFCNVSLSGSRAGRQRAELHRI